MSILDVLGLRRGWMILRGTRPTSLADMELGAGENFLFTTPTKSGEQFSCECIELNIFGYGATAVEAEWDALRNACKALSSSVDEFGEPRDGSALRCLNLSHEEFAAFTIDPETGQPLVGWAHALYFDAMALFRDMPPRLRRQWRGDQWVVVPDETILVAPGPPEERWVRLPDPDEEPIESEHA